MGSPTRPSVLDNDVFCDHDHFHNLIFSKIVKFQKSQNFSKISKHQEIQKCSENKGELIRTQRRRCISSNKAPSMGAGGHLKVFNRPENQHYGCYGPP